MPYAPAEHRDEEGPPADERGEDLLKVQSLRRPHNVKAALEVDSRIKEMV
jgi:hypothetical protein